ncbi:MAG: polymerase sigma-70 factor, subfamily [Solirubrobacterales bacterium]|jgi:RNA polymerase sigma-70 factor (ECF subfamily)|nr:polymerase sigma-70 factor, subfamily [Solirubrobacterales bacterium]
MSGDARRSSEDSRAHDLVARFQAGDETAFEEIYRLYLARVFHYLRSALRDQHEAEDLAQTVMTKALTGLGDFRHGSDGHLRAWIFTIARRELISKLRTRPRSPQLFAEDPRLDEAAPGDWLTHPKLAECFERLSLSQRQTIALHYIFELPVSETAEVLGVSAEAVTRRLRRGLVALERLMSASPTASEARDLRGRRRVMLTRIKFAPVLAARRFSLANQLDSPRQR